MRDSVQSPFVPGSDVVPDVWAGRELERADAAAAARRRTAGLYERGRAVLGEFGIGKSVLVGRICSDLEQQGHWTTRNVRLPLDADPVPLLAEALRDVAGAHSLDAAVGRVAGKLLSRIEELTLPVVGGGARLRAAVPDDHAHRDVLQLLVHLGRLAYENRRLLLVRVDEVQNATAAGMSRLLTLLGDALEDGLSDTDAAGITRERKLPLLVYLSGLPDMRERVAQAGATFARRFKTWELEPLTEPELRDALIPFTTGGWPVLSDDGPRAVHMDPRAVDLVVTRCLGDPFLFQLAGEAAWNAGSGLVITGEEAERGWRLVRREVQRYVEGRLTGLGDLQLRYLQAAAALDEGDRTAAGIARALGFAGSDRVASTAQRLDRDRGLIRREAGRVRFRSPAVEAYLRGSWP